MSVAEKKLPDHALRQNFPVPNATSAFVFSALRNYRGKYAVTSYIVSYELHDDRRETALIAALEIFEDRCNALDSIWLVCSPWSAGQIQAHLGRYLAPDDSLIVEPLPMNNGWSGWVGEDVREWLTTHLGPAS